MIAYKFLRAGRMGPFSEFAWPEPGVWVRAGAATNQCRRGIHACRTRDLPWWLADELWEIELDGEVQIDEHKIVAPAGALRARIDGWTAACAREYGEACAYRARDRAFEALNRAGHSNAADQLADCTTLEGLLVTARRLADDKPDTRISLTIAATAPSAPSPELLRPPRTSPHTPPCVSTDLRLRRRTRLAVALARGDWSCAPSRVTDQPSI